MSYEWHGSSPLRRGDERIHPGEVFEPTEAELRSFSNLIEEVGDEQESEPEPDPEPDLPDPPADPGEFSVADLRDHLADVDYDAEELQALESAERKGKNRTTALEAITGIR